VAMPTDPSAEEIREFQSQLDEWALDPFTFMCEVACLAPMEPWQHRMVNGTKARVWDD